MRNNKIYDIALENRLYDLTIKQSELEFNLWRLAAQHLGISLEEYIDFMHDMEIQTEEFNLDELDMMYAEYCQEFDIPCMQIDIGIPMKLYGAI